VDITLKHRVNDNRLFNHKFVNKYILYKLNIIKYEDFRYITYVKNLLLASDTVAGQSQ